MTDIITPGVPAQIADLYESGEIEWSRGWGDRLTHTCLHGALLRPCATPGDEIMWSILLSARGATISWNDGLKSVKPVIRRLRKEHDPDVAEMVRVFGSQWEAARDICRRYATATDVEKRDVQAAWDAQAAGDVQAAWDAWDAQAAWDVQAARAAWDAWDRRAARAAWDAQAAWAARAARAAFMAVCAYDYMVDGEPWCQDAYNRATAPWVTVFGPINLTTVGSSDE